MELTPQQETAVQARGDVLVMAGAGTGKTRVLVQRAVRALLDPDAGWSLDRMLMVTFTEAAAAEMRHRIRQQLEEALSVDPAHDRLAKQLALLDTAHICTLHSFCLELVRQHFYELGLDPQLTVLADEQSRLVASEVLDQLFKRHYTAESSEPVRALIRELYDGWDKPVRQAILALHDFTQTRPNPNAWMTEQMEQFAQPTPTRWIGWLLTGACDWRAGWLSALGGLDSSHAQAHECEAILQTLDLAQPGWRGALRDALERLDAVREGRKKPAKPLDKLFGGADFLRSLCLEADQADPLEQDWAWVRGHMTTFLNLGREFGEAFSHAKREAGTLDFHDLEQYALQLLWEGEEPSALARQWQERLELVFVDEYQDINAAQDMILSALGRPAQRANRFMVGDVKQSVYRFRQADPHIFQGYAQAWSEAGASGRTLFLSENFRSHESLLRFVNALFDHLMWPAMGGVRYDSAAHLRFGAAEARTALAHGDNPRVEVHVRLTGKEENGNSDQVVVDEVEENGLAALRQADWEARMVAWRLRGLQAEEWPVWDEETGSTRPVQWKDMVVLLRSPATKVESYAKEFARAGIPLLAKRTGFYETTEVEDLLSLLVLLDNPLQDIPALAVLRSPLVGLDVNELARIRLAQEQATFWAALQIWHQRQRSGRTEKDSAEAETFRKVDRFLESYQRWRAMARHASLAQRLETILTESHYLDWLLTQTRGEQRQANVHQLIALARQFDEVHRQGLYRFLDFIEAQKNSAGDREPAPLETQDAVRLMSIHQSKGLEFPVVVVPDLGKKFNLESAQGGILLDDHFGPCPLVKPPGSRRKYPSLPRWLAQQRQRAEVLGEELRLLYVAATRARDLLILTATCSHSATERWAEREPAPVDDLIHGHSLLQWLGPWLTLQSAEWSTQRTGATSLWRWQVHDESAFVEEPATLATAGSPAAALSAAPDAVADLRERVLWEYPFLPAVTEPAKTSVTVLRRRVETDDEARAFIPVETFSFTNERGNLTAAAAGTAHHRFIQHVILDNVTDLTQLETEKTRLVTARVLSPEEAASIDLNTVLRFWTSTTGQRIFSFKEELSRELPFTVRLSKTDLATLRIPGFDGISEDDFIVAQGVIDLAVLRSSEIWLLDFKTDHVRPGGLSAKTDLYAPQLRLYAHALERIYQRPVTRGWLHFLALGQTVDVISSPSDPQLTLVGIG